MPPKVHVVGGEKGDDVSTSTGHKARPRVASLGTPKDPGIDFLSKRLEEFSKEQTQMEIKLAELQREHEKKLDSAKKRFERKLKEMEREILHLRNKDARFGELARLTVDELDDLEGYYHQQLQEVGRAKLEKVRLELLERKLCTICYESPIEVTLVPCGHQCICERCSKKMGQCPMCRVRIEQRVRFFVPA